VNQVASEREHLSGGSQIARAANLKLSPMSVKFYTHFIAQSEGAVEYSEYRGVVELLDRSRVEGDRDIARMLARSFDLEETDIQVLQWDHLH
jgi:hypothetical protein